MTDHAPFKIINRIDLQAWAEAHEHPAWYIPNLIPVDGVTIVFGDGGSGKSRILLDACLALESGQPFCGRQEFTSEYTHRIKTAWLSFEDAWTWEMHRRLKQHPIQVDGPVFITRDHSDNEPDIADRLRLSSSVAFNRDGIIDPQMEANWLDLGETLKEQDVKLLVVDATKGLVGGQVGKQEIADSVIDLFAKIRRRCGVTTVLIAHSSAHKKDFGKPADEVMGASTWTHSARHVVFVQSNTNVTFARVTKSNWGPTGCNVQFDRVSDGPLTFRSVNTAREYAEQQSRKRTQEQFTKRTEQVKALISSAEHDPGVWKTQRSMANALGVSTSEINHMVKGGWVTKPKGASGYSPDLTKLDWTDESVESTNLGEGVPEF